MLRVPWCRGIGAGFRAKGCGRNHSKKAFKTLRYTTDTTNIHVSTYASTNIGMVILDTDRDTKIDTDVKTT